MVIVPQNPFTLQDQSDVPIAQRWHASPQLFFTCNVLPVGPTTVTTPRALMTSLRLELVFFSIFELLDLPKDCPMERAGVQKLYEPSPTPTHFVSPCQCQHVLGRVQLFLLFWDWNLTSTIPYKYCQHKRARFSHASGSTDSSNAAGRKRSNVCENLWLWQFGRGNPRLRGLSVADTEDH